MCVQCGFFKRKQREQLLCKKRESAKLFEAEEKGDDGRTTNNSSRRSSSVKDECGRELVGGEIKDERRPSIYDNDMETP